MDGPVDGRVPQDEAAGLIGLLGLEGDGEGLDGPDARASAAAMVDVVARWALSANLLRLRTGVVRPTKQGEGWLRAPAVVWFRALCALRRPNGAFMAVLRELDNGARVGYDVAG